MKTNSFYLVIIFSLLVLVGNAAGQNSPATLWTSELSHEGIWHSLNYMVKETNNGDFIFMGSLEGEQRGMWFARLDNQGDTLWSRIYNKDEKFYGIIPKLYESQDGSFHAGTYPCTGRVSISTDGDSISFQHFGGDENCINSENAFITEFLFPIQKEFILVYTQYGTLGGKSGIKKVSTSNSILWDKNLPKGKHLYSMQDTQDGGFISIESDYLVKTDGEYDTLWTKKYDIRYGRVRQTKDGGYIIVSTVYNDITKTESVKLMKTDASGDSIWSKNIAASLDNILINCIQQTQDGGYIMVGTFYKGTDYSDIWVIKTNIKGETLWTAMYGGEGSEVGKQINETKDGGYIICGVDDNRLVDVRKIYLIRLETDTITVPVSNIKHEDTNLPIYYSLSQNYPNPFNPETTIEFTLPKSEFVTLKIFNILGEEVSTLVQDNLQAGNHTYQFDGSNLASGIYLYRIEAGEYSDVKKMVLLR